MHFGELSRDQRQYVQQINERLMVIERHVKREALALIGVIVDRPGARRRIFDSEIAAEITA